MPTLLHILFLIPLTYLILVVSAASNPTSFCKCTCGSNSTIIPLDAPSSSSSSSSFFTTTTTIRSLPPSSNLELRDNEAVGAEEEEEEEKEEGGGGSGEKKKKPQPGSRRKTCNDCNKQYCLSQNLRICEGKGVEEVFTTCFQRDSRKDEAVVFIFIVATAGLLGWAAMKPWVGKWVDNARARRMYVAVSGEGD